MWHVKMDQNHRHVISTSLQTFSCSCDILSARRAVRYKAEARKTVAKANTPAAQNNRGNGVSKVGKC